MKTFWTVLIAFAVTLLLPFSAYFFFTRFMTPTITRDNAKIIFEQFQAVLDTGTTIIHDPVTAASVADRAYRDKMHGEAIDGWSNPMRISAVLKGDNCRLIVISAGPDGAFGTVDDITMQRSFELYPHKVKSP